MTIAFLFNSDDPQFDGFYGGPIRNLIFSIDVLQQSNRHMKVSIGDVLFYSYASTEQEITNLANSTYFWHPWHHLFEKKLHNTYYNSTVFAWVIQNITEKIGHQLHARLTSHSSYLGMHAIDYSHPAHLLLYRNSMIPKYRIHGKTCNLFFSMSEEDGKDFGDAEEILKEGFDSIDWEDTGAHRTIFDDYDTLEHYQQITNFRKAIAPELNGGEDDADELVMMIEDMNPRLFDALGAALRALGHAQTEEDIAHVGLSGRRFLEQLADVLFPAQKNLHNGRKVTQNMYKNRIWAYIYDAIPVDNPDRQSEIEIIGKELDRLTDEFNGALHGDPGQDRVTRAFADLAKFSILLLTLKPEATRKPYYAFEENMNKFLGRGIPQ